MNFRANIAFWMVADLAAIAIVGRPCPYRSGG